MPTKRLRVLLKKKGLPVVTIYFYFIPSGLQPYFMSFEDPEQHWIFFFFFYQTEALSISLKKTNKIHFLKGVSHLPQMTKFGPNLIFVWFHFYF